MHKDVESIIFSEEEIKARVKAMGEVISRDYADKDLVLVAVLRGAVVFTADLLREITVPVEIDFMAVSSYGKAAQSSGIVRIIKDLDTDIAGRDVLIVEDILDSGLTLKYLMRNLSSRNPASLEIAALLHKEGNQKTDVEPKYVGFSCPKEFVVGYGLDFAEKYRNLPYIGVLKREVYE